MQQQISPAIPYEWERAVTSSRLVMHGEARQFRQRDAAYLAVKRAILSGQISTGESLGEERLASALKISRTPIRESLAILEHEGYLMAAPGRGLCVRKMSRRDFLSLCEAGEMIDPFLAGRAAEQVTPAHAMAIECVLDAGDRAIKNKQIHEALTALREFHRLVGLASGNAPLADFILKNEERADFFLISQSILVKPDNLAISSQEHRQVYEKIVERKAGPAAQAMTRHTQSLRKRFADLFEEEEPENS
jgi:DNA-binding GntR family transcriptional regulator